MAQSTGTESAQRRTRWPVVIGATSHAVLTGVLLAVVVAQRSDVVELRDSTQEVAAELDEVDRRIDDAAMATAQVRRSVTSVASSLAALRRDVDGMSDGDDIDTVESRIAELENDVRLLATTLFGPGMPAGRSNVVGAMNSDLDAMGSDLDALASEVTALSRCLSALLDDIEWNDAYYC